jgi:predicted dehydrogenase
MSIVYKTLLAGFGQMGVGYADDPLYSAHISCPTHAYVLHNNSSFDWIAVVDSSEMARQQAVTGWSIPYVASDVQSLECLAEIEVAVLATPPSVRMEFIKNLPRLKAVFVEKPIADDLPATREFLKVCTERGILVQVNITRRSDHVLQELAMGGLNRLIGLPRAIFGVYGNGLANMGTHAIDLVRMLFGEVSSVRTLTEGPHFKEGPLQGDINLSFSLNMKSGVQAYFSPLLFSEYRESGLDVWGSKGRLQIVQEGLVILTSKVQSCRSCTGVNEVSSDQIDISNSGYSTALCGMYENLSEALAGKYELISDGINALRTAEVVDAILRSNHKKGDLITIDQKEKNLRVYYAHDPGAAELIAHYFSHDTGAEKILIGQGYAVGIFKKLGIKYAKVDSLNELLVYVKAIRGRIARIISGTSQSVDYDCQLWRWGAHEGIPVEVHLDHWMNLLERFSHFEEMIIPAQIDVIDAISRDILLDNGFPDDAINVSGQPVMEIKAHSIEVMRADLSHRKWLKEQLGLPEYRDINVFISENITELDLREKFGFDEWDSFRSFRDELDNAAVIIKLHPKESIEKWESLLAKSSIYDCILVYDQVDPEALVAVADQVGGLFSILLLQAHMAGIPVVSYQPGAKIYKPLNDSFVNGIRTVYSCLGNDGVSNEKK